MSNIFKYIIIGAIAIVYLYIGSLFGFYGTNIEVIARNSLQIIPYIAYFGVFLILLYVAIMYVKYTDAIKKQLESENLLKKAEKENLEQRKLADIIKKLDN